MGQIVELTRTGIIWNVPSGMAQQHVANWTNHFQSDSVEPLYMVPVYAYSFPDTTLKLEIQHAHESGFDDSVYIVCGCHSISPGDSNYCFEASRGYQMNPDLYGYMVPDLILATRKTNVDKEFRHSSDFMRPCPRFCGTSMFSLP